MVPRPKVQSTSGQWSRFESHIHISCPSNSLHINVPVTKQLDGIVKLYWNGDEISNTTSTVSGVTVRVFNKTEFLEYDIVFDLTGKPLSGNTFVVEFNAYNRGAMAQLYDLSMTMLAAQGNCMDYKTCMSSLSSSGEAGMALRSENFLQRQCLNPPLSGTGRLRWVSNASTTSSFFLGPGSTNLTNPNDFWSHGNDRVVLSSQPSEWTIASGVDGYLQFSTSLHLASGSVVQLFGSNKAYLIAYYGWGRPSLQYHSNARPFWAAVPTQSPGVFSLQMKGGAVDKMQDGQFLSVDKCESAQGPCSLSMVPALDQAAKFRFESSTAGPSSACGQWRACLERSSGDQISRILELLDAAGSAPPAVAQMSPSSQIQTASNQSEDAGGSLCMDPSIADPESWDCDCYAHMKQRCLGVQQVQNYSLVSCLRAQYCMLPNVCEFWRWAHCSKPPVPALMSSIRKAVQPPASSLTERASNSLVAADGKDLDETLMIKQCA
jgi:hypothetical protein